MRTYNIIVESNKDGLLDGLDSSAIKVLDYTMIDNESSVLAKVSVVIPKLTGNEPIGRKSSREEIRSWLDDRFSDGSLVLRRSFGPKELSKKIHSRELSATYLSSLFVSGDSKDNETFRIVLELMKWGRLHDRLSILVEKDYRTVYNVNKAVENGEIMHFVIDGAQFYID